ncbi:MAG: beta galactosidase jelly roll domain-containing protein [Bacteroidota bacterium]
MKPLAIIVSLLCVIGSAANSQEMNRIVNLRGHWRFEAGDNKAWSNPTFNDDSWDVISVPSPWEEQGYPGYDGYAWYRKHFQGPDGIEGKMLILKVGKIDDVDEVYVNGRFVGFCGYFPPKYESEYGVQREYEIPPWLIKVGGDNVIAVRVYDDQMNGGITGGEIGLYQVKNPPYPDLSLEGSWKFQVGDEGEWKNEDFNDHGWGEIYVPTYWETQGYKGYDGIGWYRLHFNVNQKLAAQRVLLLLGRVDDCDETYVNGQLIGRTGAIPFDGKPGGTGNQYSWQRAYTVPVGLLHEDSDNVIAVRVWDGRLHGGIYRGPIGLITRDHYNSWRSVSRDEDKPWEFLRDIFDR